MKKFLILGLITIVLAFVQSMQLNVAPVDNDVGITYVLNAEIVQPDFVYTDNFSLQYSPAYICPVEADVGLQASNIYTFTESQGELWQRQLSTSFETNAISVKTEGLSRLEIGEQHSQDRVSSRHIT